MSNHLSDKNVTNIDFQPMSKRFMVWDDEATDWICVPGTERDVWDLLDLLVHKSGLMKRKFHIKIVQSTNLFDKDGKEIFEGSIVRGHWDYHNGIGELEYDIMGVVKNVLGCWSVISQNGVDEIIESLYEFLPEHITIIGHILSKEEK